MADFKNRTITWEVPFEPGRLRAFVTLCDEAANTVYSADNEITCEVTGPVKILGMEDSNPKNIEYFKDNKQHAFHGKLLVYLQSLDKPGKAVITFTSPGLQGTTVEINVLK